MKDVDMGARADLAPWAASVACAAPWDVPPSTRPRAIHHLGIQTNDLANAVAFYRDFLGLELRWSLDRFSLLTSRRLPGIRRLVEITVADVRLHLFERAGAAGAPPDDSATRFQHLCLSVDSPEQLHELRDRWYRLYRSGRLRFALPDAPTDVVVDDDGVQSLYVYDADGLELEFTYVPTDTP